MMENKEWREIELGKLCSKIGSGSTPTGGSNAYKNSGISLIRSQNILDLSFTNQGLAFIDEEQAFKLRNVEIKENDILINITGDSVARVCKVPNHILPARINQHVAIIRPIPNLLDYNYIQYYLFFAKNELLSLSEIGATRNALTKNMLETLTISLPPLAEQKAIAAILSSLDDKIDLLQEQNKTLEAMAETLFRQWFIEEAKEDWEEVRLGSVIETTSGGTPSRSNIKYYQDGTIHWVKSKELNGSFISSTEEKITETAIKNSSAKLLPAYSILIAMYGATVGEYCIISKEMACNQAICALKPNEQYPYTFLYLFVKQNKEKLINMAVGSAQQNISQQLIKQLPIISYITKISDFHNTVYPYFNKIQANQQQIQTLTALRDTLLPKLMSGEVRVRL